MSNENKLPLWKTEKKVNVDTGWVYPEMNESIAGSPYLTSKRGDLMLKGHVQIEEATELHLKRINRIMVLPNILALILWPVFLALTVWGITTFVSQRSQDTLVTVLASVVLTLVLLCCARGIVCIFRALCCLLVSTKLKEEKAMYQAELENISSSLKSEMASVENEYFEKVMEAQFKYGSNNTGIALLAEWCCGRMMKVLEQADKRQFLEKITAGMTYTVYPDHVPVTPRPEDNHDGHSTFTAYHIMDPKSWTFRFREHSIYDIPGDVFSLVGCAQALATHIQEKLPEHMTAEGYDPLIVLEVFGEDNQIKLDLTAQNPKFVPFVEM